MKTISVADMARDLGVSTKTVYGMLKRDQIPNLRLARVYLVSQAAWERWLANLGTQPSAPSGAELQ